MSDKRFFQVASHGRTATYWLAACINKHPDVLCSHGGILPPNYKTQEQPEDDVALYAHETAAQFGDTPIDTVCDELVKGGDAKVYGMVHAYAAYHLITRPQMVAHRYNIAWINVVRHPVTRVESLARRIAYETKFSSYTADLLAAPYDSFVGKDIHDQVSAWGVDLTDLGNRTFLYALCFIPAIDSMDFQAPMPHITMESLTRDPETFAWFFRYVTQSAVPVYGAFLDDVFSSGRMNHQAEEKTAVARFEGWEPWKRDAARLVAGQKDFARLYGQFHYDLSFLS